MHRSMGSENENDNTFKEKEKDVIIKTIDNLMFLIYNESQSYEKYYTNIKKPKKILKA